MTSCKPEDEAITRIERVIGGLGPVVVGFSGGADSSLLAFMARRRLGREAAICVTAVSASLAPEELADCESLAGEWDLDWRPVHTGELKVEAYASNGRDRCYYCKSELMAVLAPLAAEAGATAVLGVNLDDLSDHRPGQRAAAERGALFPLVEAALSKSDVRAVSRRLGLRTADKPAAACLASRVPYGTRVTLGVLQQVGDAESGLRRLGFDEVRVRHYGELARLEVPLAQLGAAVERRTGIVAAIRAAGYRYVTLDLEGFRSGNLNDSSSGRS